MLFIGYYCIFWCIGQCYVVCEMSPEFIGEMVDKLLHEGENVHIVGGGGQHQLAVAEGIGDGLRHVAAGQLAAWLHLQDKGDRRQLPVRSFLHMLL